MNNETGKEQPKATLETKIGSIKGDRHVEWHKKLNLNYDIQNNTLPIHNPYQNHEIDGDGLQCQHHETLEVIKIRKKEEV